MKAGLRQLGEPGSCNPKCPHSLAPRSRTPCQLLAAPGARASGTLCAGGGGGVCARTCGQDMGEGSGMGHPAAGEAQSTALSQGLWPMAPRAAVLPQLGLACGQRLDLLPCWGHQSQGRTPGALASHQNRGKNPLQVRPAVQPLNPASSLLTSPLSKGSSPGPYSSILLHICISNLLQRQ